MTDTSRIRSYGFNMDRQVEHGTDSLFIRILARKGDSDHPINCKSDGESMIWDAPKFQAGLMLDKLQIKAYWSANSRQMYFVTAEYREPYSIGLRGARAMVRTLERIEKIADQDRSHNDLGDYLMSIARALGLTWHAVDVRQNKTGWSYSDGDWQYRHIVDARDTARKIWRELERDGMASAAA